MYSIPNISLDPKIHIHRCNNCTFTEGSFCWWKDWKHEWKEASTNKARPSKNWGLFVNRRLPRSSKDYLWIKPLYCFSSSKSEQRKSLIHLPHGRLTRFLVLVKILASLLNITTHRELAPHFLPLQARCKGRRYFSRIFLYEVEHADSHFPFPVIIIYHVAVTLMKSHIGRI